MNNDNDAGKRQGNCESTVRTAPMKGLRYMVEDKSENEEVEGVERPSNQGTPRSQRFCGPRLLWASVRPQSPYYCLRISNLENFTFEIWFTEKGDPEIRADVLPGMLELLWTEKASPPASSRTLGSIRTAKGQCCREIEGSSSPSYQSHIRRSGAR